MTVSLLELDLPAHGGNADAVAVAGDSGHHPFHNQLVGRVLQRSKAQGIQEGNGSGTHGENVANDSPHSRCRSLIGLDKGGVIVRFHLEDSR